MGPPTISSLLSFPINIPYFLNHGLLEDPLPEAMDTRKRVPTIIPTDLRTGVKALAVGTMAANLLVAIPVLTAALALPATGNARVVAVIAASMTGTRASLKL